LDAWFVLVGFLDHCAGSKQDVFSLLGDATDLLQQFVAFWVRGLCNRATEVDCSRVMLSQNKAPSVRVTRISMEVAIFVIPYSALAWHRLTT